MSNMLTAKDVQEILQVDRSTVYRMAEDGRLPAVKVGKQWRFPLESLQQWLGSQVELDFRPSEKATLELTRDVEETDLAAVLPLECVQLIQDSHAELLGVMIIVTDIDGNPITRPSNACGLFAAISEQPRAVQRCISSWHDLGHRLSIEPTFQRSHLGLLCARGLIRVGKELPGMVIAGCIAPDDWPPSDAQLDEMAAQFGVEPDLLRERLDQVYYLSPEQQSNVLNSVQRVANIVAHIVNERQVLLSRLDGIADLARL